MEMQVIKNKSTLELQQHEETLRAQLFALRIQSSLGKLETPHMINNLRKDIARIKTELSIRIKNGEKIKPLPINKMVLPEEKKEVKKAKKVTKVDKKDKVKSMTKSEVNAADKDDQKVVTGKTTKPKLSAKEVKKVVTTKANKAESPSKKSTVKKTVTPAKEDKE
ncbi:50S ribosomal protein L29 [Spiroplasma endosymbiont of Polydrusus pterygomalis]|uniref:50S ribosomal protein L29 n=1 Tax=Spiroplasma endosymbiont of Polydrusus pterygomalis TaxID=3139327 RepID=UPI003CCAC8D9